jgi:hypothetical protein
VGHLAEIFVNKKYDSLGLKHAISPRENLEIKFQVHEIHLESHQLDMQQSHANFFVIAYCLRLIWMRR